MALQYEFSLTIRFAASLPDLSLSLPNPYHTSVLSLVCQIREHLPTTHRSLRLRLIHAGRVLTPTVSIATGLRLPPPPALPTQNAGEKTKGKEPVRSPAPLPQNIYIHATFSDALAPAALDAEKAEAQALDAALLPYSGPTPSSESHHSLPRSIQPASPTRARRTRASTDASVDNYAPRSRTGSTTSQMPQGFDRLLAAGLSPLEVASLRSQFVAILAHTHTPDTMPGAAELRVLEERWLDNDHDARGGMTGGVAGPGAGSGIGEEDTGGLEDMLWGNIMGFFWPIGAVIWLMREEGVWTQRRRVAVVTGALVNLAFSVMRAAS